MFAADFFLTFIKSCLLIYLLCRRSREDLPG